MKHKITLSIDGMGGKKVYKDNSLESITMTPSYIKIGCTEITPEAAEYILKKWQEKFGKKEETFVLQ